MNDSKRKKNKNTKSKSLFIFLFENINRTFNTIISHLIYWMQIKINNTSNWLDSLVGKFFTLIEYFFYFGQQSKNFSMLKQHEISAMNNLNINTHWYQTYEISS